MGIEELVRENVKILAPYSSARDEFWGMDYVLLDANENPYDTDINRYPDPYQRLLKTKVAKIKGVRSDQIFIGNGSDEIIDLLFRVFCEPYKDTCYALSPSYGMYKVSASINAVDIHYSSLRDDFSIDVTDLLSNVKSSDKLLFLCSPNNPTGNIFSLSDLNEICYSFKGIVIIDEAYIDFSDHSSMISRLDRFDNLVVLQTMSKAWGAAGLRVGLGFMNKEIVHFLNKIKPPYNVNQLSQNRALKLLEDVESHESIVNKIISQRKWLESELKHCKSVIKVHNSEANYILVQFQHPKEIYELLKSEGIIVRDRTAAPLCSGCLRLTIGKSDENIRMLNLIKSFSK
tara:strand:+ start:470 stop:1504 length:1035 start_codon:yes stop_codon:yes gene_type:complete